MAVPKSRGSFCCWFIIGLRCFLGRPFCVTFAVPPKNCGDSEFDSLLRDKIGLDLKTFRLYAKILFFFFFTSVHRHHNVRCKIHDHRVQLPYRQHSNECHIECSRSIQHGILIHVRASLIPKSWDQHRIEHIVALKITWSKPKTTELKRTKKIYNILLEHKGRDKKKTRELDGHQQTTHLTKNNKQQ